MEQITTEQPKRPQFLTVLCILTYIGVGIGVIGGIFGWWFLKFSSMTSQALMMSEGMSDMDMNSMPEMADAMKKMEQLSLATKWADVNLIVTLLGCTLCLIGAIQMWKLKKMGFYIYAVGELTPLLVTGVLMGAAAYDGVFPIMMSMLPLLFVVLYGLNFKHLTQK